MVLEIDEDLASLLRGFDRPLDEAIREILVLELYRRGTVSSSKAAELLHMSRLGFIQHADRLGIPYFDMTNDEWAAETSRIEKL